MYFMLRLIGSAGKKARLVTPSGPGFGAGGISNADTRFSCISLPDYQYVFRMSPIRLRWAGVERWSFCRA